MKLQARWTGLTRNKLSSDHWSSIPNHLSLSSEWKQRLSTEGKNLEWIVDVRRMIKKIHGRDKEGAFRGKGSLTIFKCLRRPEGIRDMVCVPYLLADYYYFWQKVQIILWGLDKEPMFPFISVFPPIYHSSCRILLSPFIQLLYNLNHSWTI